MSAGTLGPVKDPVWQGLHFYSLGEPVRLKAKVAHVQRRPGSYIPELDNSCFSLRKKCGKLSLSFLPGEWPSNPPQLLGTELVPAFFTVQEPWKRGGEQLLLHSPDPCGEHLIGSVSRRVSSQGDSHPSHVLCLEISLHGLVSTGSRQIRCNHPLTKYPVLGSSRTKPVSGNGPDLLREAKAVYTAVGCEVHPGSGVRK